MYTPPQKASPLNLRSVRLKIERAKKHIVDLDTERIKFLGTSPYKGVPKYNVETDTTQFILGTLPEIPDSISLIVGDAIHNLRVALDYLACELVRSVGESTKNVYFPICETSKKYDTDSAGKTKGMPQAAKEIIDRIKPYGPDSALWVLHQLDIIDKHHLLPTMATKIGSWQANLSSTATEFNFALHPILEEGTVIGWTPGNHEADKQMDVTADIAFREPEIIRGRGLLELLNNFVIGISRIVSYFEK